MCTDVGVKAAQEQGSAIQLGHPGAQSIEDTGKLHRDITSPNDGQTRGKLLKVEHLIRADGQLATGKFRNMRPAAGGYEDLSCRVTPLADNHRMGIDDPCTPLDHVGMRARQ